MDMIFDFAVLVCVLGRISGELTTQVIINIFENHAF